MTAVYCLQDSTVCTISMAASSHSFKSQSSHSKGAYVEGPSSHSRHRDQPIPGSDHTPLWSPLQIPQGKPIHLYANRSEQSLHHSPRDHITIRQTPSPILGLTTNHHAEMYPKHSRRIGHLQQTPSPISGLTTNDHANMYPKHSRGNLHTLRQSPRRQIGTILQDDQILNPTLGSRHLKHGHTSRIYLDQRSTNEEMHSKGYEHLSVERQNGPKTTKVHSQRETGQRRQGSKEKSGNIGGLGDSSSAQQPTTYTSRWWDKKTLNK